MTQIVGKTECSFAIRFATGVMMEWDQEGIGSRGPVLPQWGRESIRVEVMLGLSLLKLSRLSALHKAQMRTRHRGVHVFFSLFNYHNRKRQQQQC